jgi:hypothetical protein
LPELVIDHSEVVSSEWRTTAEAIHSNDLAFNHAEIIDDFLKSQGIPF